MSRLPRFTAAEAIRLLAKRGFRLVRQSGSHKIFKNDQGVRATIPFHAGKRLHPKLVKQLLEDLALTSEDIRSLL